MLTVDQTVQTYAGSNGCMCGCKGTYNEGKRARKMAMTALLKNSEVQLRSWKPFPAVVTRVVCLSILLLILVYCI